MCVFWVPTFHKFPALVAEFIIPCVASATSNTSLLPGGVDETQVQIPLLERVQPSAALTHTILAILHCDPNEPLETMAESSVMGFVYV